MAGTKAVKLNFMLETAVADELNSVVPAGQRSKVVNAAVKKELLRIKRRATTEKLAELRGKAPKVSMAEIVEHLRADRAGR
jgi:hypothetical protein